MIQSILIQNFQSWPKTLVEFHPGLNVLTGQGDSGKSAILRGIRWCAENRIRQSNQTMGDSYVSRWAKKKGTKGAVTLTDDCLVMVSRPEGSCTRFRESAKTKNDKETNGYDLNGSRYLAIGVGVPDPVTQWFNWTEINIQKQFDPAFLVSKGAGEVASFLNKTVRLDDIDTHISAASGLLRSEKIALGILQDQQGQEAKVLEALDWVPEMQGRLETLETLEKAKESAESRIRRLSGLLVELERLASIGSRVQATISLAPRVQALRKGANYLQVLSGKGNSLRGIVSQWKSSVEVLQGVQRILSLASRVQGLQTTSKSLAKATEAQRSLRTIVSSYTEIQGTLGRSERLGVLLPRIQALKVLETSAWDRRAVVARLGYFISQEKIVRSVDWDSLASRCRRAKALARGAEGKSQIIAGMRSFLLKYEELGTSITRSRELVQELSTRLPEVCPTCNRPFREGSQ